MLMGDVDEIFLCGVVYGFRKGLELFVVFGMWFYYYVVNLEYLM